VGRVEDEVAPGQVEERGRPPVAGGERGHGGEGLGHPLEGAFGAGSGLAHVGAVGGHAHQQVGPGTGAQLAGPGREALGGGGGQVVGQRGTAMS
jgi:hypothetical protein